ncbi:hypothetical protein G9P44_004841 [Scheffersomyces stipitis]|nr:hypothetical protein G9P44_004841 [Scheffersomyces stipitis]
MAETADRYKMLEMLYSLSPNRGFPTASNGDYNFCYGVFHKIISPSFKTEPSGGALSEPKVNWSLTPPFLSGFVLIRKTAFRRSSLHQNGRTSFKRHVSLAEHISQSSYIQMEADFEIGGPTTFDQILSKQLMLSYTLRKSQPQCADFSTVLIFRSNFKVFFFAGSMERSSNLSDEMGIIN